MATAMFSIIGSTLLIFIAIFQSVTCQGSYSGVKTADQQCRDMGYSGLCGSASASVCSTLICADSQQRATIMNRPLDGTGCGFPKVCISGSCVSVDPSDTNPEQSPYRPECSARWGAQG